jgi:hypothetical protein
LLSVSPGNLTRFVRWPMATIDQILRSAASPLSEPDRT